MKNSYEHLPQYKQEQLKQITAIIVKAVDPEKVILFGSHATGRWVEDRFTEGHITYEYISDYDVLVITKQGDKRKDYEVQDIIENRCIFKNPVTVITHDIDYVNKQLSEGHYFFSDIEKEGILLYDAGTIPLAQRRALNPAETKAIAQKDFEKWYSGAVGFLKGAFFYKEQKELRLAAFMLHQAAERAYIAILLVHTGYKSKTHNLDKLRRFTKRFAIELSSIFPCNSEEEKHLFDLVKRGYVDARYKDDYMITEEDLIALLERVQHLLALTEKICKEKIASFDIITDEE